MNYLAHALLSPSSDLIFIGNFCGDFVKGVENPGLHPKVWQGVKMHRAVDTWTDNHELVKECKKLFSKPRRRFAGIILDMAFDHLLSVNWNRFCETPRLEFIKSCYQKLNSCSGHLPPGFLPVKHSIISFDWLGAYHSINGLGNTLNGISRRFKTRTGRVNPLSGSVEEVTDNYEKFEEHFLNFFPQLQAEAERWVEPK